MTPAGGLLNTLIFAKVKEGHQEEFAKCYRDAIVASLGTQPGCAAYAIWFVPGTQTLCTANLWTSKESFQNATRDNVELEQAKKALGQFHAGPPTFSSNAIAAIKE
jgi:quinol monooxygenase YgiN